MKQELPVGIAPLIPTQNPLFENDGINGWSHRADDAIDRIQQRKPSARLSTDTLTAAAAAPLTPASAMGRDATRRSRWLSTSSTPIAPARRSDRGGANNGTPDAGNVLEAGPSTQALDSEVIITLAVAPESAAENSVTNIVYTFSRTGSTANTLTVYFTISGSATLNSDYIPIGAGSFTATTGSVTFAAGAATASITIDPTNDNLIELDETLSLTLASGAGYSIGTPSPVVSTILNTGLPLISVSASPTSVMEDGGAGIVYTLTRSGYLQSSFFVYYQLAGSAIYGSDYSLLLPGGYDQPGRAVFGAGQKYAYVTVNPIADALGEENESVLFYLPPSQDFNAYFVSSDPSLSSVTGTILNDDAPAVTLAVSPPAVTEAGDPNLLYTFTRGGSTASALTVNFAVSGTAIFNTDYVPVGATSFTGSAGSITFAAGASTTTMALDPSADGLVESDETTILTLTGGTGYSIGTPSPVVGTILQGALPVISLSVAPAAVTEDSTSNLIYTFKRTGPTTFALPVNFSVEGTAKHIDPSSLLGDYSQTGADAFSQTSGIITFAAGSDTATLTVNPRGDRDHELDEIVSLKLATSLAYTIGTTSAVTGTIVNDDLQRVFVDTSTLRVLEDGSENIVFDISRFGLANDTLTAYFTVGGTANFGSDYTQSGATSFSATAGSVTFLPGVTKVTVTLDPTTDSLAESDETVSLTVAPGSGYESAGSPATSTIYNVSPPVGVAEDGASRIAFPFSRSGSTTDALSATFTLTGTATAGIDYIISGIDTLNGNIGTFSLGPGETTRTILIDPIADGLIEADETAILRITSIDGVEYFYAPSTGIILNDDPSISLVVSPATGVQEDGTSNLVYTFSRTGPLTNSLTVNFSVGGTATLGTDYTQTGAASFTASKGTVTFLAGASTATVAVNPTADTSIEASESVVLTLAAGTDYFIGTTTAVSGTIINDDLPLVNVSVSPASVRENGSTNLTYTFTRSGSTSGSLTVLFAVAGSATFSSDYSTSGAASFGSSAGSIVFAAGSSTAALTINPTADFNGEGDETINLTLLADSSYKREITSAVSATILNDDLIGTSAADTLTGRTVSGFSSFPEYISGLEGNDIIRGGSGIDTLVGGTGSDTFVYGAISESAASGNDRINDFIPGSDRIDLSRLDPIPATTTVNEAFIWLGLVAASSISPGRAGYSTGPGGVTLFANTGTIGTTSPDFRIDLPGVSSLSSANILL